MKTSSRQRIWCRGVLTPSNLLVFLISSRVRFPKLLRVANTLPLPVNIAKSGAPPLNLSTATKLKDLSFQCRRSDIQRVTMALQSVQSENLQQIIIYPLAVSADLELFNIHPYGTPGNPVKETVLQEWRDLERVLVRFWTSHSIRSKILYKAGKGQKDWEALVPRLLPELTRRGLFDLVEKR
jgi:hypothetical protein